MPKVKLGWRFRKHSEADPFEAKPCGCKMYVYDGTVVRTCPEHTKSEEEKKPDVRSQAD